MKKFCLTWKKADIYSYRTFPTCVNDFLCLFRFHKFAHTKKTVSVMSSEFLRSRKLVSWWISSHRHWSTLITFLLWLQFKRLYEVIVFADGHKTFSRLLQKIQVSLPIQQLNLVNEMLFGKLCGTRFFSAFVFCRFSFLVKAQNIPS